jgi:CRISPR system Cascade subunit CasA
LVQLGLHAKKALRGKLYFAVQGHQDKELKGIAVPIHETGEKLFYARTEGLIVDTFRDRDTFERWREGCSAYVDGLAKHCRDIFEELTDPYAMKPELIPIIAWARRSLNADLRSMKENR